VFREEMLRSGSEAERFARGFDELADRFLDIAYDDERLHDRLETLLKNILELSYRPDPAPDESLRGLSARFLQQRLLDAVGDARHDEALDVIETGRVSWKLRDDDNLLVARLQSQLLRALSVAAERLRQAGKLIGDAAPHQSHTQALARALREPTDQPIDIRTQEQTPSVTQGNEEGGTGETPRQLIGQPASPGVATGTVRCIRGHHDLGDFRQGEVLVCDAIQPTMTHLVPLASAIVERRGGMLIHGAIIARELGIPCVNGVRDAADILKNGFLVTVDGHLGIVTVGAAEFDLELGS
jgi:pyruvate,water dikinase